MFLPGVGSLPFAWAISANALLHRYEQMRTTLALENSSRRLADDEAYMTLGWSLLSRAFRSHD